MQSVAVSGLNAADFAVGTNTCATGFNVVPGDSCTVGVSFSPKAAGGRNATLTITGDAGADSLPLSGNGVAPPDSLAPSTPGTPAVRASGANGLVVTWADSTDNVGVDHYDVFRDGGTVAIAHPTTATFTDTALAEASTHRYTVKAVDAAGNASAASLSGSGTTADLTAPTQTHNPAGGATAVSTGSTVTATFNESVQGVAGATFTLKNPAGTTVAATVGYNATTRVATLTPSAALAANTVYTAALTGGPTAIRDVSGNPLASASWTFTTGTAPDGTKPVLSTRTPGVGATGVAIGTTTARTPVTATFSEAVTGVSGTTVTLKQGTTAVAAAVTYNATTHVATLTPSAPLVADKTYTVGLTAGIKDVAGNPITATTWTFITGPRPTVTARTPAVNALNVGRTANVTATFSEAITGSSAGTVTLKNTTTGVVQTAVVSYNTTTRVVTLNPSATLAANTKFTVTLTAGLKDAAGNPITATTWTFTTGAA